MRLKAIILDFDGVLVESTQIKDQAFHDIFKGFEGHQEEIGRYLQEHPGIIRFQKFRYVYEQILHKPYTDDLEQRLAQRFADFVIQRVIDCPAVRGAEDLLNFFCGKLPLYVASVNPEKDLETILKGRGWDRYFKKVYAVPGSKVWAIKEILKTENIDGDETLFIGDNLSDLKDAHEAKVRFIGREKGATFKDVPVKTVADLAEALKKMKQEDYIDQCQTTI